jgi:hypothetical protein
MHKFTLYNQWDKRQLDIDLTKHTKESFVQTVKEFFGETEFASLSIKNEVNVPAIFRTPDVMDTIVADSIWEWLKLDDYDQKLLAYYMEITQDSTKTLSEAKIFKDKRSTFLRR